MSGCDRICGHGREGARRAVGRQLGRRQRVRRLEHDGGVVVRDADGQRVDVDVVVVRVLQVLVLRHDEVVHVRVLAAPKDLRLVDVIVASGDLDGLRDVPVGAVEDKLRARRDVAAPAAPGCGGLVPGEQRGRASRRCGLAVVLAGKLRAAKVGAVRISDGAGIVPCARPGRRISAVDLDVGTRLGVAHAGSEIRSVGHLSSAPAVLVVAFDAGQLAVPAVRSVVLDAALGVLSRRGDPEVGVARHECGRGGRGLLRKVAPEICGVRSYATSGEGRGQDAERIVGCVLLVEEATAHRRRLQQQRLDSGSQHVALPIKIELRDVETVRDRVDVGGSRR